jgi:hypothetical protein
MKNPYLSLVLTGRNDNYGGDFRSRLQHCVSNAHKQLKSAGITAEILFVNYNPVEENEPIERFIEWPKSDEQVSIRIVTIPNLVHQLLVKDGQRKDVPVLEYFGKNAGIRRAKGEFILSMNPDIILTENVINELKKLSKDSYYRANRIDFSGDLASAHELKRVFLKGHDYPFSSLDQLPALRFKNRFANAWKCFTPNISSILNRLSKPVYYEHTANRFHCNVSGDFMLIHRDYWFELGGQHENTSISLHVDSLMVVQAAHLGLKEKVLEHPIFHQEHERRYDATKLNPEFEKAYRYFEEQSALMIQQKKPEKYNDTHWGLAKFSLPETNP